MAVTILQDGCFRFCCADRYRIPWWTPWLFVAFQASRILFLTLSRFFVFPCGQLTGYCGIVVGPVAGSPSSCPNEFAFCRKGAHCGVGTFPDPDHLARTARWAAGAACHLHSFLWVLWSRRVVMCWWPGWSCCLLSCLWFDHLHLYLLIAGESLGWSLVIPSWIRHLQPYSPFPFYTRL